MGTSTVIPKQVQDRIGREIESGERVQWVQMPIPRFFTSSSVAMLLFGVLWTGFMVFWIGSAADWRWPDLDRGQESAFPFLGVPGLLIGIGLVCSPLYFRWRAHRTVYVITNRRAIVFDGGPTMEILRFQPEDLQGLFRRERRDGTGDVILGHRVMADSEGFEQTQELGFFRIRDPKEAERMLQGLAGQAARTASGGTPAKERA